MKKIILAFDGSHYSEGAFEFARKLNEMQKILLVGVFVPQAELANLWSYAAASERFYIPLLEADDAEKVQENMERFEKSCIAHGIKYKIHKNFTDLALHELETQSRFADLLILGSEVFFEQIGAELPNDFLEDALHSVNCPVIIVPEKYDFPESIVLAYDGSDNSLFALKTFSYLFPEFRELQTMLVYAKHNDNDIPVRNQLEELLDAHFPHFSLMKFEEDPGNYFNSWIVGKHSTLLVCGSYGRSGMSRLFKKSFIRDIIAQHQLPVFIAHR